MVIKKMTDLPYAEDINFWKTSKSSADDWMEKTKRLIVGYGGSVIAEAFGSNPSTGRGAFMLTFDMDGERFKVAWPVLPSKSNDERSARKQAATLLYHDIKGRVLSLQIFGARTAFFNYLMLKDGRTVSEWSRPEIIDNLPLLFAPPRPLFEGGEDHE